MLPDLSVTLSFSTVICVSVASSCFNLAAKAPNLVCGSKMTETGSFFSLLSGLLIPLNWNTTAAVFGGHMYQEDLPTTYFFSS